MSGRMNWSKSNIQHRIARESVPQFISQEIQPDERFWQLWKADRQAMRADGYRVLKTDQGWRVFRRTYG